MPTGTCIKKDCTWATTGVCLELYDPITTCPNFKPNTAPISADETEIEEDYLPLPPEEGEDAAVTPSTSVTKARRRFHPGTELGLDDAAELMRGRYAHLIGVLGQTDAGKTAFLSSLYLMASRGWMKPSYTFAGSLTLQGFEDRSRGLRKWDKGRLADKFTARTQLADPRKPSFMNLALREMKDRKRHIELLLTDLPGEWTNQLINRAEIATRFDFMKRADGVIYVIDGRHLADSGRKHVEVHKAKLLLGRLLQSPLVTSDVPLVLLVSKSDELDMNAPPAAEQIREAAVSLGFEPNLILSASFSRNNPNVQSGTGVIEAISFIVNYELTPSTESNDEADGVAFGRMFGKVRRG
jgi:double-GTPase-like protein